jgi:hypothetical protein
MIHNVYFWLKKDLTPEQRASFETELGKLPKISYVTRGFIGKPAPTEERPVTDHSFDYSLLLEFKNLTDHEFYQKECKDHANFVATCVPFFDRVIVYDNSPLEAGDV